MQQLIDFIIRKKNVFVYFLLLSFSLSLIFKTNLFQKSKIIIFSNSTANYFNEMFNNLNGYFDLRRVNSELVNENLFLKNQLENVINKKQLDSLDNAIFKYQNAKVISNSFSSFKNYLIIDKGLKHGLENEMGIISSKGIVGIINYTTKNYSSVMSVLNIDTKINAKVKRTAHFGTLEWNGLSSKNLLLNDIPETAEIKVGDSIITGGMSLIFPEGINIGVVSEIIKQKNRNDTIANFMINNQVKIAKIQFKENYLNIVVKLHTDMNNLDIVYVIESLNKEEFKNIKK
ncbi:MAG: rod shape-determining protein MreC [Flavobacteriaceae bacterium]|nr:rod shape-determining protein MreC [Flavobacteriaceae bacterium]